MSTGFASRSLCILYLLMGWSLLLNKRMNQMRRDENTRQLKLAESSSDDDSSSELDSSEDDSSCNYTCKCCHKYFTDLEIEHNLCDKTWTAVNFTNNFNTKTIVK